MKAKKIFTTGDVAAITKVAPRTVSKWFDAGRLKGYRIPGSNDRRIPREQLIRFLKEHGMPLGELEEAGTCRVLLAGLPAELAVVLTAALGDGFVFDVAGSQFEAGLLVQQKPAAVVLDASLGRSATLAMAGRLRQGEAAPLVVVLRGEDDADCGGDLQHPVDPARLADLIREHAARQGA